MKIICTAEEAAEIIYACGKSGCSGRCLMCALQGVCNGKGDLFDVIHIAEDNALYARKFIQKEENDGGLVI